MMKSKRNQTGQAGVEVVVVLGLMAAGLAKWFAGGSIF